MHYIKLLRPPQIELIRGEQILKLVIAITTDLGDSYLSPKDPIDLLVIGAYPSPKDASSLIPINLTSNPRTTPKWKSGDRVLKLDLPLPPRQQHPITTIQIRPLTKEITLLSTTDIYPPTSSSSLSGLIMPAFSDISVGSLPFRSLRLPTPDTPTTLQIEEDMGDSIARHIWDSGIATTSLIADMLLTQNSNMAMPTFQKFLKSTSEPLQILEIGCGIGTLGIALARILSLTSIPPPRILMTDLPEAETRARANISRQPFPISACLEFEPLDWEEGKLGKFGTRVQNQQKWDLIVVSDCTYNTDTLGSLVGTLGAVHKYSCGGGGEGPKVFLATKSRHSSEREFFDLMKGDGWKIEEEMKVELPHIDGEGMPIEIYLFGRE
ncbi:putative methyltransferase-domain-containing protein [Podospora fimiseda]|uniref:Methyltransferase-domain-containing protein n=1 Tax=Podospora fimiseda TaxID=252190 RepID=A0AAN7BVC8_9PEZI|nr:putative methyltransferase-domain-containing protein [Podospora fimiseda]